MINDDWYLSTHTIAELWDWLVAHDMQPRDPSDFLHKPWKWEREFRAMLEDPARVEVLA